MRKRKRFPWRYYIKYPVLRSCHSGVGMIPESFRLAAAPVWNGNGMAVVLAGMEWEWNFSLFARDGMGMEWARFLDQLYRIGLQEGISRRQCIAKLFPEAISSQQKLLIAALSVIPMHASSWLKRVIDLEGSNKKLEVVAG